MLVELGLWRNMEVEFCLPVRTSPTREYWV